MTPPEPVEARELTAEDIEDNRLADAIAAEWSGRPEVRSIVTSEGLIYVIGPLRAEAARPSEGLPDPKRLAEAHQRVIHGEGPFDWDAVVREYAALDQPRSGEADALVDHMKHSVPPRTSDPGEAARPPDAPSRNRPPKAPGPGPNREMA